MHRIILLGGSSLSLLEQHITRLRGHATAFYSINRKAHIEEAILSKIHRVVEHWCIFSPPELQYEADNVRVFLQSPTTSRLITSSAALALSGHALPAPALAAPHKLFKADHWLRQAYDFYHHAIDRSPLQDLAAADGVLNSLFVLLLGMLMEDNNSPIYLFGCDGAPANYKEAGERVYFGMDLEALHERTRLSNIHQDMLNFEKFWKPCVRHFKLDDSIITNVNPYSHYSVFRKQRVEDLF